MPTVLFVCTANQGRSPIAEAIFRKLLNERSPDAEDWRVNSAGTWAQSGKPAASGSRILMADRGMDLSRHRSRPVTARLLAASDLIITMEAGQKESICIEFPEAAHKVFLLSEMVGDEMDISDPIQATWNEYVEITDAIQSYLERGFDRICQLAAEESRRTID
jgi:protein-tyrosine-phosphatase